MRKVIKLTENDLVRIVKIIINENFSDQKTLGDLEFIGEKEEGSNKKVRVYSKKMPMYEVVAFILEIKKNDNVKYLGKVGVIIKHENGKETITLTDDYPGNVKGFVEMPGGYDDVDFIREFIEKSHRLGKAKADWLNAPKLR